MLVNLSSGRLLVHSITEYDKDSRGHHGFYAYDANNQPSQYWLEPKKQIPNAGIKGLAWQLLRLSLLIILIIFDLFHAITLAEPFLLAGVFTLLFYTVLIYSARSSDSVIRRHVKDYAVILAVVLVFILLFLPFISAAVSFTLLSPVFLLAGIKSLYEAPKEFAHAF